MKDYTEYACTKLKELTAIDSPDGFTKEVIALLDQMQQKWQLQK